jgi:hypothetical protein
MEQLPQKNIIRFFVAMFLLVLVAMFPHGARAQYDLGSITGNVRDPNGSAIVNAQIDIKNTETGATRKTVSSADGSYSVSSLAAGTYAIKVTAAGFRALTSSLSVNPSGAASFDATLTVGQVSDQVTVVAGGEAELHTDSHQIEATVSEELLTQLPDSGRNILDLAVLGPGAQRGNDYNDYASFQGSSQFFATIASSVMIGGMQNINTTFLQDGVVNVNLMTQSANIVPSVESAKEVNTLLSGSPARYDRPSVVNIITRNGTGQFHGVLYDFLQNEDMDARNYQATTRPPIRYNLFGGNFGGPILRNKLFGFFDYSGLRNQDPMVQPGVVPTLAERACATSSTAFCDFTATGSTLYDPATYSTATGSSQTFASEYGINGIPGSRINNFAKLWLNLYPTPNVPTAANASNYVTNVANQATFDQYLGRVDYTISPNQQIFGTVARVIGFQTQGGIVPGLFGNQWPNHSTNASIEHTAVLSPRLVNVAKVGYNRNNYYVSQEGVGTKDFASFYGIQNLNAAPAEYAPPTIYLGSSNFTAFGTPYTPQGDIENRFDYSDELDYTIGKHSIAAGTEFIRTQIQGLWSVDDNGQFNYTGVFTSQYAAGVQSGSSQGNALADFLLGYPYWAQGSVGNGLANFRESDVVGYIQDDWKLRPNLVLNLGIRYAFDNPPLALGGHSYLFNLNTGVSTHGTWNPNYNDWAPRVGFSWSPLKATTVVGGYGIYYTSFPYNDLQFLVLLPPNHFVQLQYYTITNPTPIETSLLPAAQVPTTSVSSTSFNPRAKDGSTQEFNLAIEKAFLSNVVATVAYAGSLTRHIGIWSYPNQPIAPVPGSTSGQNTVTPYPNVGQVNQWENEANSNYNALLVKVTGTGHGFHGIVSYAYSKAMDYVDADAQVYEKYEHPEYNYAVASWDRPQQLTVSGTYQLPIGPSGRFLNRNNVVTREALSGWQLGAIYRLASGEPVTISANNLTDNPSVSTMYANKVCDARKGFAQSIHGLWFNPACFAQPAVGTYGRGGRNAVRSPREDVLDLSLDKTFHIYKEHGLQFRAEAFNALNHTQWFLWGQSVAQVQGTNLNGFGSLNFTNQGSGSTPRVLQVGLRYAF